MDALTGTWYMCNVFKISSFKGPVHASYTNTEYDNT